MIYMYIYVHICDASNVTQRHQSAKYKMGGSIAAAASFQEIYFMRRLLHSQWVSIVPARQEHGHYWGAGGVSAEQTADQLPSSPLPLNIQLK